MHNGFLPQNSFFFFLKRRFEWQSGLAEVGLSLWMEEGGWERKWEESGYAGRRAGVSPGKSTCPGPKRSLGLGWACRLSGYSRTNKQPRLPGIWADQIFCGENGNTAERAQLRSLFHPLANRVNSSKPQRLGSSSVRRVSIWQEPKSNYDRL